MTWTRFVGSSLVLALSVTVVGCEPNNSPGTSTASPIAPSSSEGETPMEKEMTWQEAKAQAQAMELEIASLIPENKVIEIVQNDKGPLLVCGDAKRNWHGETNVTLAERSDAKAFVKQINEHYRNSQFTVVLDNYFGEVDVVQLIASDKEEMYFIRENKQGGIYIGSASSCFTLPEGVYPGGKF